MKLSTRARYGLYACIKLAKEYESGFINISDISSAIKVSNGYLEQIMSLLKKGDIVVAQRGAMGGYLLSNTPDNISVGKVLRSVEDDLKIVDCISQECSNSTNCLSHHVFNKLYNNINNFLDSMTLKSLLEENNNSNETNIS